MPTHPTILRQREIVAHLKRRDQPVPFVELRRHLRHNGLLGPTEAYPLRSLQRDVEVINTKLNVSIKSRRYQGYYIAEEQALPENEQRLHDNFALHHFLTLPATLGSYVQPEPRRSLGLDYLHPLLHAAQTQRVVDIDYLKHTNTRPDRRTFGPLLLREFRGRWYVLGTMEESGYMVCLGLDRIQWLQITDRTFDPPADFDPTTYLANCFGIERPNDNRQPEEIRLRFTTTQGRYALSFPLHASQQLETQTNSHITLIINVYDTHELRMELLSYGPTVEVLAPAELRNWLHKQHKKAASFAIDA